MERHIALLTEWAWSQGLLASAEATEAWAHTLLRLLGKRFPSNSYSAKHALPHLRPAIAKTLRALQYGGRTPADLLPARRELLEGRLTIFVKQV